MSLAWVYATYSIAILLLQASLEIFVISACLIGILVFFFQIYEKVASVFKLDEGVVIANLDADKHRDLAEKYVLSYIQKWFIYRYFPDFAI